MAERDPSLPQSADPELQANLTRLLQIQGPLGILNVLDVVVPVVNMGQVVPLDVDVRSPAFRSTDIFANGPQTAQPINTILADTGQLQAGVYDVQLTIQCNTNNVASFISVEHRNAANAANLAIWTYLAMGDNIEAKTIGPFTFGYEIGVNERLRMIQDFGNAANDVANGIIFARRRA